MRKSHHWLAITEADIVAWKGDVVTQSPLVEAARVFLNTTCQAGVVDRLSNADLLQMGKLLADFDALMSGPNILKWQNLR